MEWITLAFERTYIAVQAMKRPTIALYLYTSYSSPDPCLHPLHLPPYF